MDERISIIQVTNAGNKNFAKSVIFDKKYEFLRNNYTIKQIADIIAAVNPENKDFADTLLMDK